MQAGTKIITRYAEQATVIRIDDNMVLTTIGWFHITKVFAA